MKDEGVVPEGPPDPPGSRPDPGTEARRLALEAILESDGGRKVFIDEALEARLARVELPERDRHLLQEIAFGTVRHRNTIDRLLEVYVRFPMKRQRPSVRWALRIAAYQVVYLSRIPVHAAIDRTIEALKGLPEVGDREAGFLNAVLRKLSEDILRKSLDPPVDRHDPAALPIRIGFCYFRRPVLPLHSIEPLAHIALKHSHPQWLVERWMERLGEEEAIALCAANNRIPQVTARITSRAPGRESVLVSLGSQGIQAEPVGGTSSIVLRKSGDPRKLEAFRNGWIQIQDPTATAIGEALRPPAGARVLDLCAAPGGKAAQLLEAVGPQGSLVACDIDDEKLARLEETLARSGGPGAPFTLRKVPADPEEIRLGEEFTHILLDAPCSNTGVLARRPEARWRIQKDDLPRLAGLQLGLLAAAARHLAPGGRLVYATCSIEPEEDDAVVARALSEIPRLRKAEEKLFLPRGSPGDGGYWAALELTPDS